MWKVEWINNDGKNVNNFRYKYETNEFIEKLKVFEYDYMCYELKNLTFDKLIQYCWENKITDTFFSENGFHIVEFEKGEFKEKQGVFSISQSDKFKMN